MQQLNLKNLPPRGGNEGMFGYDGKCADIAFARDDADLIEHCFRSDFIDFDTKMFTGISIAAHAKKRAPKCYERLLTLGFAKA
jgi:hypothetical protein